MPDADDKRQDFNCPSSILLNSDPWDWENPYPVLHRCLEQSRPERRATAPRGRQVARQVHNARQQQRHNAVEPRQQRPHLRLALHNLVVIRGVGNEEREVIGDGGAALPALTENIIPPT